MVGKCTWPTTIWGYSTLKRTLVTFGGKMIRACRVFSLLQFQGVTKDTSSHHLQSMLVPWPVTSLVVSDQMTTKGRGYYTVTHAMAYMAPVRPFSLKRIQILKNSRHWATRSVVTLVWKFGPSVMSVLWQICSSNYMD